MAAVTAPLDWFRCGDAPELAPAPTFVPGDVFCADDFRELMSEIAKRPPTPRWPNRIEMTVRMARAMGRTDIPAEISDDEWLVISNGEIDLLEVP